MSVVAANSAVNTPQHKATAEQIRLAQLIEDKKHDHPEVQEMLRKVLDVVPNSNQDDALLALFDCDYDFERTVALLIEKGHDVASEWRTATNHKVSKKQQKTTGSNRMGHEGETDENGQQQQQQQRGNDGYHARGKSRGGGARSRYSQQPNGNESPNVNTQQNENYSGQTKSRGASGGGNGYRGRGRGQNRGGSRPNDRNYQQQIQQQGHDSNVDNSVPSDTTSRTYEGSYQNRRGTGAGATGNRQHSSQTQQQPHQSQDQWDVGNWNGETLIYSRTAKDEESAFNAETVSSKTPTEVSNSQTIPSGGSTANPITSERNAQQTSSSEFDPVEAARQIKNVIGIGHAQQAHASSTNASQTKSLMDLKPLITDSSVNTSNKSKSSTGHTMTNKVTPTPPPSAPRIPHQPVVFSDRFDGGLSKIDVEFGNLDEGFDEKNANKHPVNVPVSSAFYSNNNSMASVSKLNNNSTSTSTTMSNNAARLTNLTHHPSNEQTSFMSPTGVSTATRPNEQLPVMNQQRLLPSQQASMAMKTVVSPVAYAVHQAQPQMNTPNMALRSLFYHHQQQQQQEPVPLDNTYDPTAFSLQSTDFISPYFMTTINPAASQQQGQPHYLVPQTTALSQAPPQGQVGNNRQSGSTNVPTSSVQTTSASTATSSTAAKKAPAVPPGIFIPSAAPPAQAGYSTAYPSPYGVPLSVGGQQQNAAASYAPLYDAEHSFTNSFTQFANPQQAQSPSGTYGSVTPPVQQQGTHTNNDNKTISYAGQHINENLLLLQQYSVRQSNNQGQGQQGVTHSPAQMSYYLGHPPAATSYSPVHPVMYAQAAAPMTQQQPTTKQQGQHYNQPSGMNAPEDYYARTAAPSSSSTKEGQYMYSTSSGQAQQGANQSAGQPSGPNKQHGGQQQQQQQQQRANNNTYHNQSNPTRSYQ